ncbi:MAG: cyclopropane-fatty-acyl-phospholipid synthase family protein [Actinomycetota bacterium]
MFAKALLAVHQRICRFVLLALARAFVGDELEFSFGGRSHRACRRRGSRSARVPALHAQIEITDMRAWPLVLLGRSAGLGEAWSKGYWETPDLTSAIRVIARATSVADGSRSLIQSFVGPITDRLRRLRPQDKHRDRQNIGAHYDLGNEFFEQLLDPTMMYSSALFSSPSLSLEEGSVAKLDRLCRMIDIRPGDRVLEIGTGWGGFAIHAATRFGAHVTTTTISAEQFIYAKERVAAAGLEDQITVLGDDYRDLSGSWDRLVSIEMIEAVDWRDYDTFFSTCCALLVPGGVMGMQAIVIETDRFERAKNTRDFIKAHIFPGGCLPSIEAIERSLERVTDFSVGEDFGFGADYAETLRRWRVNLHADEASMAALGLDQQFLRLWDFYLCYCEAGFDEKMIDVVQMRFARPLR